MVAGLKDGVQEVHKSYEDVTEEVDELYKSYKEGNLVPYTGILY